MLCNAKMYFDQSLTPRIIWSWSSWGFYILSKPLTVNHEKLSIKQRQKEKNYIKTNKEEDTQVDRRTDKTTNIHTDKKTQILLETIKNNSFVRWKEQEQKA